LLTEKTPLQEFFESWPGPLYGAGTDTGLSKPIGALGEGLGAPPAPRVKQPSSGDAYDPWKIIDPFYGLPSRNR
jgi:hypothetical protein